MKIVATDIPKTIEDYQIALNAAFEGGKVHGAAAEREACAKVCEQQEREYWGSPEEQEWTPIDCAAAIRARGKK